MPTVKQWAKEHAGEVFLLEEENTRALVRLIGYKSDEGADALQPKAMQMLCVVLPNTHPGCDPLQQGMARVWKLKDGSHVFTWVVNSFSMEEWGWWARVDRLVGLAGAVAPARPQPTHYPHTCPACKYPAYLGAVPAAVECSRAGCRHHRT